MRTYIKLITEERKHRYSYYLTHLHDDENIKALADKCEGELLKIDGADDLFGCPYILKGKGIRHS